MISPPPTPKDWQFDVGLCACLAGLNTDIAIYVLRALDTDAGRTPPIRPEDEHALGQRLSESGRALIQRARDRGFAPEQQA